MTVKTRSDFDLVKDEARGHWASIIGNMYPDLQPIMRSPGLLRCACPIHGSSKGNKADGFRFYQDFHQSGGAVCNTCGSFATGINLVAFLEGCTPVEAVNILKHHLGLSATERSKSVRKRFAAPVVVHQEDPEREKRAIKQRRDILAKLWNEAKPLKDLTPDHHAIRYIAEHRGVGSLEFIQSQRFMRYHPDLYYSRSEKKDEPPISFPALISMMHGVDGKPVGLHRIFLHPDKPMKAPVENAKKILRRLEWTLNGAVRLSGRVGFSHHANVCEGIETGLAISYGCGHPVFAAGYTTLVKSWKPLDGVKCVTIWCDRDENEAGLKNSMGLKERLADDGIPCRILVPEFLERDSEDWNDVLLERGHAAIHGAYSGVSDKTVYL